MAPIGPQIPSHLLQRTERRYDEDEDEEAGPQRQKSPVTEAPSFGPQIPVHLKPETRQSSEPDTKYEDGDEDDYVPELPPDLAASRFSLNGVSTTTRPVAGPSVLPEGRRVLGPSLLGHDRKSYDEDDDDDEYGPTPVMQGAQQTDSLSEGVREFLEKEEKRRKEIEEASKPKQLKRDEWMLVPPSSSDLLGHLSDPLKLKARQFSRGGSTATRGQPNNLWTETPAERQQRIADEVAGKKRRAVNADDASVDPEDDRKRRRRDEEIGRVIEEHNKSSRGKSLLDMHSDKEKEKKSTKSRNEDDDELPAIWDHDRDMAMGGRIMDEKQRSKLITDARSLGDRFGRGKAGGYL